MAKRDVLIVGAGLSGLSCARVLHRAGLSTLVLEGSDGIGGRVRTDRHEGFLLDRGFQVLLSAYPECRSVLDYQALDLRPFAAGSLVHRDGKIHRLDDPWRNPGSLLASAFVPVGSLVDKWQIARLL